ncbi:hypothetical protein [Ilumatobacter nonamiensis]|uniref:hypothetical protein n=1 Tax=Ilumatobacter nonamiensis TaxID=467093 RepID=UPI00034B2A3E|nr:hypothetical protein [Ilumatobacter nonamiensis]
MAELADVLPMPNRSDVGSEPQSPSIGGAVSDVNRRIGGLVSAIASTATSGVRSATSRLTQESRDATDDWGCDPVLVRNMMMLAQLRWDVSTGGDHHLPKRRGALVVVNSPRLSRSSIFTAFAISEAIDRPVRFVAKRELLPVTPFDRRIGGLRDHPDEIAGALRADEVVVLGAAPTNGLRSVGTVDHVLIGAALATSTRVFPAATTSSPFARRARVEIGSASHPPRKRRGPLTELELADRVRSEVHDLLNEMGDLGTGTPLDWLPLAGGGN